MSERHRGLAVIISGPSGAGKTTICNRLARRFGYKVSVSVTSRAPRAEERSEVDYYFVSRAEFLAALERGEFLEYSEHFGNLYGTPKVPAERALNEGSIIILAIDVKGATQIRRVLPAPDTFLVFVTAPNSREAERRLRERLTEDEMAIRTRLQRADMEIAMGMGYDAHVVNDDLDRAVDEIHALIQAEAGKSNGCGQT